MKEFKVSIVQVYHETFSIQAENGAEAIEEATRLKGEGGESELRFNHTAEPYFWIITEEGESEVRLGRDYL